jgi:non-ribosomal peptide synthetase component F
MPFEKLVEEIQPERASRQAPLFNITFGVQNTPRQDQKLRGVRIRSVDMEQEKARFDLTLWVTENAECLQAHWTYRKDLFEEEAILRMHGHFESLLVNRPDARLTTLIASSRAESRLNRKEQSNREESDVIKLLSVKRKGIDFSAENV